MSREARHGVQVYNDVIFVAYEQKFEKFKSRNVMESELYCTKINRVLKGHNLK